MANPRQIDTQKPGMKTRGATPWLVVRDYNDILTLVEKQGGRPKPEKQMSDFCQMFIDCDLRDLGFAGPTSHGAIVEKGRPNL